jgi:hypothetical protein
MLLYKIKVSRRKTQNFSGKEVRRKEKYICELLSSGVGIHYTHQFIYVLLVRLRKGKSATNMNQQLVSLF